MGWRCGLCNEEHDELPFAYGAEAPWRMLVPEDEFDDRVELHDSVCVIDGEHFFVRGKIELPVHGHAEPFQWSVWCSVSKDSFHRMMDMWEDPERVHAEPYFGWLSTSLPMYDPGTLNLKTKLHEREPGTIPLVELEPTDHPLAVEQREGISMERVEYFAHALLGHGRST